MRNTTLRRLAIGASAITVLGVGVPFVTATAASAAEPTSLSVSPTTQYVGVGNTSAAAVGTANYTVTLSPSGATAAKGVSFDVYSGPDSVAGAPLTGVVCTAVGAGASYTCAVPYNDTEGTDSIHFYVPATAGGNYQAGVTDVDGTLVKGGPAVSYTISPTTKGASTDICASYVVSGTDADGNPASGAVPATVTETLPTTTTPPTALQFCKTDSTTFPTPATTTSSPVTPAVVSGTNTTYKAADSYAFPAASGTTITPGSVTIGVSSDVAGTLNISAGTPAPATATSPAVKAATATATISAGNTSAGTNSTTANTANNNNAATLTLTPGSQSAFPGGSVTETVTAKDSAGNPIGGVSINYEITSGPDATTGPVLCTSTTNGLGQTTCTYTAGTPAAGASNADAFIAYTNQSTPASPTTGPDAGEPQAKATITVSNPSVTGTNNLTSTCDADAKCTNATTNPSKAITFTLKDDSGVAVAGETINFTTTNGTVSPTSGITDANGQVTVTETATTTGSTAHVTGTTADFGNKSDTATVTFKTAGTATDIALTPTAQQVTAGQKISETVTATDGFTNPVTGTVVSFVVTGRNNSGNNAGATGSCTTGSAGTCVFSYTDMGAALTSNTTDTVTASATGVTTPATATEYYYTDAAAKTVTLGINDPALTAQGCPATTAGLGSTTAQTSGTETASGKFQTVCVTAKNAAGADLNGESVTVTSSGVGGFVSSTGAPVSGSSTTATVMGNYAKVYVRSGTAGTQTLTATDGAATATGTVTYSNNNYNPVAPQRLVDTRSGQGGVNTGPLAPNTNYTFDVSKTGFPTTGVSAYVFNVTAINPSAAGNLRIGPSNPPFFFGPSTPVTPSTSLINYVKGQTSANAIVVPNTGSGDFTLYSDGASANVAIDVTGYYVGGFTGSTPPSRVADTRTGDGGTLGAGTTRVFQVAPASTTGTNHAIALNVTAIAPSARGYLQVFPDGATQPTTSNINYVPGQTKAAFVVVQLPASGKIDVYTAGASVNVAIDVFGTYPSATTPVTQTPARIYDTRTGAGELENNVPRSIQVTGKASVPADAQAVLVSVTGIPAKDSTGVGNLRVFPTGQALPTVSTLNYNGTYPVANFAIVPLGTGGQITLDSNGSNINASVDVLGYVPAGS